MKNLLFLFTILALFSCKKKDQSTDLRIKSVKYYRNDSLIGQTDYQYADVTGLLEYESTHLSTSNYFSSYKYSFLNDSIVVEENSYNGVDTLQNEITIFISGTEHLVSKFVIRSKPFLITTYERNYIYDASDQLSQVNYYTSKQAYDFVYNSGDVASFKVLFPRLVAPFGTDTSQIDQTYISRSKQPGINFDFLINTFNIPEVYENGLNLELAGCSFNITQKFLLTRKITTFGFPVPGGEPVTTYSYTFDNKGRVQQKSFKTESAAIPSSTIYRTVYEYM